MKERRSDIQVLSAGYRRSGIWNTALDFLFPRRCPFCDEVVRLGDLVCPDCEKVVSYIGEDHCMKCGKPLLDTDSEYCKDCMRTTHLFNRGRALYVYNKAVRASITRFKYHNRREYATFYGRVMAERLGGFIASCHADCLIPVPISKEKLEKRGYNQAELLAKSISDHTGIPIDGGLITRVRDTSAMKELTRTERMKNLKGAFKITSHVVKCRSVIIIDDIYTTGSTIDAMTEVLKKAGAENVYFVTLAAGVPV